MLLWAGIGIPLVSNAELEEVVRDGFALVWCMNIAFGVACAHRLSVHLDVCGYIIALAPS